MGLTCLFTELLNKNTCYYSNIYITGCTYAASEIQKTSLPCEPLYLFNILKDKRVFQETDTFLPKVFPLDYKLKHI